MQINCILIFMRLLNGVDEEIQFCSFINKTTHGKNDCDQPESCTGKCEKMHQFSTTAIHFTSQSVSRTSRDENRFKAFSNFHKFHHKSSKKDRKSNYRDFQLPLSERALNCVSPADLLRHFSSLTAGEIQLSLASRQERRNLCSHLQKLSF